MGAPQPTNHPCGVELDYSNTEECHNSTFVLRTCQYLLNSDTVVLFSKGDRVNE